MASILSRPQCVNKQTQSPCYIINNTHQDMIMFVKNDLFICSLQMSLSKYIHYIKWRNKC